MGFGKGASFNIRKAFKYFLQIAGSGNTLNPAADSFFAAKDLKRLQNHFQLFLSILLFHQDFA